MRARRLPLLIALLGLGLAVPRAHADEVILVDGRSRTGKVVSEDKRYVVLQTKLGRIRIARADVRDVIREGAPADSPALPSIGPEGIDFNQTVDRLEAHMILEALELTDWNKNRAAQLLGLNRTTLLEKIKKKGLQPGEPAPGSPTATNS